MNKTGNNLKNHWNLPKILFKGSLVFILGIYIQFAYLSLSPVIYGKNIDEFSAKRNTIKTNLKADRGVIYDRNSNVLALNVSSYTVIAYLSETRTGSSNIPKHVVDKEKTAKALEPILNMTYDRIMNLLSINAYQVELGPGGRNITELKKDEIEKLNLPGISFMSHSKRHYPNGDFASYLIGYAKQYEKTIKIGSSTRYEYDIVGELSIEGKYNDVLKGKDGYLEYQQDLRGYKIPDTKETRIEPINGNNIHLTLDSNIQRFMEDEIKSSTSTYNPEWMILTAMDAKTGEILGSVSTPSFDPNKLNIKNYENPLTSYVFEPGSVMKIYTYMCAIDKGVYKGTDEFLSGSLKVGTDTVNDWNKKGWGTINFDLGFEYSSNVGASLIASEYIKKSDLQECFKKYGFGAKTDIELPRELEGTIKFNYPIEVAAASYGQGITSTAMQQLQALSIIANDGYMVKPKIINKIVDPNTNEVVYKFEKTTTDQIVKKETAQKIKELMFNVVNAKNEGTTGKPYYMEGYDLIGKTATSQVFDNKLGRYSNDVIYSFGGMFPKNDPKIIIYGAMKKPTHGANSGLVSSVKKTVESISKHLSIHDSYKPDETMKEILIENYINKYTNEVKEKLNNLNVLVLGFGDKVINQSITEGVTLLTGDRIILLTNDSDIELPNLKGMTSQDAETILKMLNLKYNLEGYGYVKSQLYDKETETINLILEQKYVDKKE